MANETLNVAVPLPDGKRKMVNFGCMCMMLFVSMVGAGIAVAMTPLLKQMDALSYFSLLTIFATLGLTIMNPIGGKLGDLIGRRNIIVYSGLVALVCTIGLGLIRSFVVFAALRLILGAAQGAFTAAPYIIAREINPPKEVPKVMGMLASSVAVGGFVGAMIAGAFLDMGMMSLAIMFPVIPLILGIVLIGMNMPNRKRDQIHVDMPGVLCLVVLLSAFTLSMNFGTRLGWTSPIILAGLALTVIALVVLVKVESKASEAIIPIYLFKNKKFVMMLLVGFTCVYYQVAMSSYSVRAVQEILGQPSTVAGSLQMPRTIITMILPTLVGAWVGKKSDRGWKAMLLAAALVAVAFIPLAFLQPATPVILLLVCIGITGISESFRSVTITPMAQQELERKDLGVGTALITFANTLASLVAAAISGVIYDAQPDALSGYHAVVIQVVVVALVGCVLTLLFIRPKKQAAAAQAE